VANSVSAPSVQGTALITVRAATVAITPVSALIPLNATQSFTGSVGFDPTASNIAWELVQGGTSCPSACGSIAPTMTANGGAITYSAPDSLPGNATVTLKATSVPDNLTSTTATIVITSGSVQLAPLDMTFVKTMYNHRPPPQTAILTNTGKGALAIQNISIGGTDATRFSQTNTCGTSVPAGAPCDITVSFSPPAGRAVVGTFTAILTIDDASSDSPQQMHLTGSVHYGASAAMLDALVRKSLVRTPPPGGSNDVGTRDVYLLDTRRADPYVANSAMRELRVRFWYPAAEGTSCVRAAYLSPQVRSYVSTLLGVTFPEVSTHSCRDAPMSSGPHPVVVLTHGFTGTSTDYTFIAEDLASRGYVVASVDHTHEATAVEFPDGRVEKSVLGSHLTNDWHSDAGTLGFAVAVRLADLRFVLDELERLNARRDSHFAGRLDLSRIALAGHSLGGLTTLRALESEPRFKAGIVLDGVMPPHFAKPIEQPVLSMVAGRERWNEDDCRLWDALQGPRLAVNFPGAEHIALSDAVWLLDGAVHTGTANTAQAVTAIREYVAGFLDGTLRERGPGSWSTSSAHYPGAVVATGAQFLCRPQ
jgi:predicted dienelactone hydrolase